MWPLVVCFTCLQPSRKAGRLLLQFSVECGNRALERKHNFVCFVKKRAAFVCFCQKESGPRVVKIGHGPDSSLARARARPPMRAVPRCRTRVSSRRSSGHIKNPNGHYGASRLYTTNHDRHCDATKDKATEKPNARRVGNGMEGASKTMGTLARNSLHHEWRAQKLEWVRGSNTSHGAISGRTC